MALTPLVTRLLIPKLLDTPGARVAAMGYPDVVAPIELLRELIGGRADNLKFRDDSEAICKWHGLPSRDIPTAESLFAVMEADLDVFDIASLRGNEIIRDLNYPIDEREEYDFVLDVGTVEHCFNIGQAIINMAGLLKEGGMIFHGNPMQVGNHGFYGLQPTWYADFYGQDGFQLMGCCAQEAGKDEIMEVPLTARFNCPLPNVNIFAAARRTAIKPIQFVTQTKYKKMIGETNGTR